MSKIVSRVSRVETVKEILGGLHKEHDRLSAQITELAERKILIAAAIQEIMYHPPTTVDWDSVRASRNKPAVELERTTRARILNWLTTHPRRTAHQISTALKEPVHVVRAHLAKLHEEERIHKGTQSYRAGRMGRVPAEYSAGRISP